MTLRTEIERSDGVPASVDELRYLVLAAQRHGSRTLAAGLREHNLTPAQTEVLEVLAESGPLTLVDLGRSLVCEAGSPSRLVDTLVQRGLVTRDRGTHDRRIVTLALTADGRKAVNAVDGMGELRSHVTDRLTADEVDQLATLLRKLLVGTPASTALATRFAREQEVAPGSGRSSPTRGPKAGPKNPTSKSTVIPTPPHRGHDRKP
ncbi:MarR family winged helix-turn-helix transcriptional regulator [Nocardia noduli]|uniref:MarR family winged helix-turn-helix transcriptional regulator n=1 Tax=Nocardia noduli TaxID=2815722 RepID=UPI001C24A142|nr:MarR family transcriptional regulator [Nocardia noduli]